MFATSIKDGREKFIENIVQDSVCQEGLSSVIITKWTITSRWKKIFSVPAHWLARIAVLFLDLYRWTLGVSLSGQCRFYPSCSTYARRALLKHGLLRGSVLSFWRLLRCNPWNPGGIDEP